MRVTKRTIGPLVILDLDGRLTVESDLTVLQNALQVPIREGVKRFVLNLVRVRALDCAGIGVLVTAYCAIQESGGELVLVSVEETQRHLLEMVGLLTVLSTHERERHAVNALLGAGGPAGGPTHPGSLESWAV